MHGSSIGAAVVAAALALGTSASSSLADNASLFTGPVVYSDDGSAVSIQSGPGLLDPPTVVVFISDNDFEANPDGVIADAVTLSNNYTQTPLPLQRINIHFYLTRDDLQDTTTMLDDWHGVPTPTEVFLIVEGGLTSGRFCKPPDPDDCAKLGIQTGPVSDFRLAGEPLATDGPLARQALLTALQLPSFDAPGT